MRFIAELPNGFQMNALLGDFSVWGVSKLQRSGAWRRAVW